MSIKNGQTLIELLIYMGILSIFMVTLTTILVSILDVQMESEATSSVEQDSRFILGRLYYDMNRASQITTPSSLGQITSSMAMVIDGITYTYSLSSGNLTLSWSSFIESLNSSESKVDSVTFQKLGNVSGKETVKINFSISSQTQRKAGPESKTFVTTVGTR